MWLQHLKPLTFHISFEFVGIVAEISTLKSCLPDWTERCRLPPLPPTVSTKQTIYYGRHFGNPRLFWWMKTNDRPTSWWRQWMNEWILVSEKLSHYITSQKHSGQWPSGNNTKRAAMGGRSYQRQSCRVIAAATCPGHEATQTHRITVAKRQGKP